MPNPISFRDVAVTRAPRKIGPGRKHRYVFFRRFMPHVMAHRASITYNITRGRKVAGEARKTRYYYPELMDALKELDKRIKVGMELWHVGRDEAIKRVWHNLTEDYRSRGVVIDDWQELYKRWLNDTFVDDSP